MIDSPHDFYLNQDYKIRLDYDVEKEPFREFFYSNGVHLLLIKKVRKGFALCGLCTNFFPLYHQNDFDVYYESDNLVDCVREFERYISLLLLPKRFEDKKELELF